MKYHHRSPQWGQIARLIDALRRLIGMLINLMKAIDATTA